jgi:hypothetical protein
LPAADASGVATWSNLLAAGGRQENVLTNIIASAEYYAKSGGTDAAFVRALYQDVLGRTAVQADIDYWTGVLRLAGRSAVVWGFVNSDEYRGGLIAGWYQRYLGRAADAGALGWWLGQMRQGMTQEQVQAALLTSAEYHQLVEFEYAAYNGSAFVRGLYVDVLGRKPSDAEVNSWAGMFAGI